jgi:hypothetical protein
MHPAACATLLREKIAANASDVAPIHRLLIQAPANF